MINQQQEFVLPQNPGALYNLNLDWKFHQPENDTWPLQIALDGARDEKGRYFYETDYDDSSWQDVSLPHTFNDVDSFRSIANDAGDMGVYRGFAFYRKQFTLPFSDRGKQVFVEFEGIRQAAYVYLNGVMVGYYEAGVAPFGFDLSKHIKYGEPNILAVAADNTSSRGMVEGTYISETKPGTKPGSNTGVGFQWNCKDFNPVFGGLTRNVLLHVKHKVYQTLPLYSNLKTKGTYVYATEIDVKKKAATISVESEVRNVSGVAQKLHLEIAIVDHQNQLVKSFSSEPVIVENSKEKPEWLTVVAQDAYADQPEPTDISSLDSTVIKVESSVNNLQLWSPDSPYLYQVYSILKMDDQVLDIAKVTTGFRKLDVRGGKDGGVFINDKFYWLTGYAQRATNEWAATGISQEWMKEYDAKLVRESNANYIRWMHIAAQLGEIRASDKYGIVAVQPAGDKEREPHGRQWAHRVETMRDVILFWEAGNSAINADYMREMVELRKALDPYGRPMGCRSLEDQAAVDESEWVGTMLGRRVRDRHHYTENGKVTRDKRAIIETEYHREESPRRVWDDYSPPDFDYVNRFTGANGAKEEHKDAWDLTAEDFIRHHVSGYYEFYSRRMQANSPTPYYSAAAAMIWSDSNQHGRLQATENCRMSGRVDPVRIKKQSFYAFKAIQSSVPEVYLVGHWNYPTDPNAYVYGIKDPLTHEYTGEKGLRDPSNKTIYVIGSEHIRAVELMINHKSVGYDDQPENVFLYKFPGINIMQPGYIEAVGYDAAGKELCRHKIETVGEVAAIRLTPVTGPEGLRADGADIAFVDVEVVDAKGRVHPLDYERIDFEITGPATFLGGYNSGIKDLNHDPSYVYAECGTNRVFVRSTREPGSITITAKRSGLKPVSVTIESTAFDIDASGLTEVMPQTNQEIYFAKAAQVMSSQPDLNHESLEGDQDVSIYIDGKQLVFDDNITAYRLVGLYGPAFALFDRLGLDYNFEQETGRLTIRHGNNVVETRIADSDMYVNGVPGVINDWPEFKDGILFVEISAVIPALGFDTYWGVNGKEYHIKTQL